MKGRLRRLFGRSPAAAPYIETRLERLSAYPPMPPPPPPPGAASIGPEPTAPVAATPQGPPQVKLLLADGTESALSDDPEFAARANYLVKSMLPPRPPAPGDPA